MITVGIHKKKQREEKQKEGREKNYKISEEGQQ
jgi:hypothetical protein